MNLNACRQHTWMMTLLCVGHCFCAVSITQSSTNVVKGSSLNIIATLDEDGLSWTFKGGTPLTTCSLSFNGCLPSMDKNMVFSASSITNTSTISIASLNCSINTAIYVARTDSSQTDTVDIDVTTPVSSILSTTVLTTSKVQSQDLSVEVECVYPMSTITANFTISRSVKPDDILFPDSIQTSTSSSGCECSEATYVVKKTITASQYPNEVVQVQANIGHLSPLVIGDVNFTAGRATTVEISTTTSDEMTTSPNPSTSILGLQTTEPTGNIDIVSTTSLYEISESTVSINTFSVSYGQNMGEDHLHFILIIVVSFICGVIVISVTAVVIFYRCERLSYSNKSNKNNKSVESESLRENKIESLKGTKCTRNIKRENIGGKKKKSDRNEQKGEKRIKDKRRLSKTENEYNYRRRSLNMHAFELNETVDTRQNQMTYRTERRDFDQIVTIPKNSRMNVDNSQLHGQTKCSGWEMLDAPRYNYNFSKTLRYQRDVFLWGGHYTNDRLKHSDYYYNEQRPNVTSTNYQYDSQLSNTTHSGYPYEKYWLDNMDTI